MPLPLLKWPSLAVLCATQDLKAAKARYRAEFDRLKELRGSLEPLAASVADAKRELIAEFEGWEARVGAVRCAC